MLWTEFMSADGYFHNPSGVIAHILRTDFDHETIAQIFGGDEKTLLYTAQHLDQNYDFAGIELNMGCPSPKIMTCAAWSWMLRDKERTLDIIKRMAASISKPFSIKTRIGLTDADIHEQFQFLINASEYVHTITIHGRTYKQSHAWDVNREFIYRLKEALPDKVIIGNWGLRSYNDCIDKLWNLDGMMTGQSAIGNPRILTPHTPTTHEKISTIIHHLSISCAADMYVQHQIATWSTSNPRAHTLVQPTYAYLCDQATWIETHPDAPEVNALRTPVEFRKYLFAYLKGIPGSKELKTEIAQIKTYGPLKALLQKIA